MGILWDRRSSNPVAADGWRQALLDLEHFLEVLVQQARIDRAQPVGQGEIDLEDDEHRRREPTTRLEATHRPLAHTGHAGQLLLREAQELAHAPALPSESLHPL